MGASIQREQEVRFAVVLYGGVSLAVYINGIAQEMMHLVRSTAADPRDDPEPLYSGFATEGVYRKLAQLLPRDADAVAEDARRRDRELGILGGDDPFATDAPIRTRFVIDIVSGSSAGGINGIYLAKALAGDLEFDALQDVWVREGDIAQLLNDAQSVRDLNDDLRGVTSRKVPVQKPPESLLDGRRMYLKLLHALDRMADTASDDRYGRKSGAPRRSLVDDLDLFVTATDLHGLTQPIALTDRMVDERRHKKVFHFSYSRDGGGECDDFGRENNPFLAFAARCTSAFPFAFQPMTLDDALLLPLLDGERDEEGWVEGALSRWQAFYKEYERQQDGIAFASRSFADGGDLDNKPFSYAIDTIPSRHTVLPVVRKLVYVEPGSDGPGPIENGREPDALDSVLCALTTLPRYETIREDLQRVADRNVDIARLERLMQEILAEPRARVSDRPRGGDPNGWLGKTRSLDVVEHGSGYAAYERLKLSMVTDDLTQIMAEESGVDAASGYVAALRVMVGIWRAKGYASTYDDGHLQFLDDILSYSEERGKATETEKEEGIRQYLRRRFLLDFDVKYRLRRVRRLVRVAHDLAAEAETDPERRSALASVSRRLEQPRERLHRLLRRRPMESSKSDAREFMRQLEFVMEGVADERSLVDRAAIPLPDLREHPELLLAGDKGMVARATYVLEHLGGMETIGRIAEKLRSEFREAFEAAREELDRLFDLGAEPNGLHGRAFEALQQAYLGFETYDSVMFPITFGTDLGETSRIGVHRINPRDPGRLDKESLPGGGKLKGDKYMAFSGFLDEKWREHDILWGRLDGADRLITMLLPEKDHHTAGLRAGLIDQAHKEIVTEWLRSFGTKEMYETCEWDWMRGLGSYLADVPDKPDAQLLARTFTRGATVTGQVLEHVAEGRNLYKRPFSHLVFAGRVAFGLVEVSVPRSLPRLVFTYWSQVLLLFSVLLLAVAVVLGDPPLARASVVILAGVAGVSVVRHVTAAYMTSKRMPSLATIVAVLAAAIMLVALFVLAPWVVRFETAVSSAVTTYAPALARLFAPTR